VQSGSHGAAAAPAPEPQQQQILAPPPGVPVEPPPVSSHQPAGWIISRPLVGILGGVAVIAIAVAVYFAFNDTQVSRLAGSLRSAVNNGRLVTLSNDDAYSFYFQLKGLDADNKALKEAGSKVLSPLRQMGDEVLQKRMSVQTENVSDQDWTTTRRVYEWAHSIDPGDRFLEAKWKYAEAEVAKSQNHLDDAERNFRAALQLNQSWALPNNRLGLLYVERKRFNDSINYFERAIQLEPNWEFPYNNLGTAYFNLKSFDTAERFYRKAIELNSRWARPHYWLGEIYERKPETHPQAIEEYQRVRELDPDGRVFSSTVIERKLQRMQK